jgi:hypothetical protein
MKYKKLLYLFFFSVICFVILLEAFFNYLPIPTNITDTRLLQIKYLNQKKFSKLYLGSSVTLELMGTNPYKYKNIVNITSTASTTFAGQYLLAKKVLSTTKINDIIFSFVPIMLSYDIFAQNNKQVSRFFNQPFNQPEFLHELRKYKYDYTVKNEYFMSRQMYLDRFIPYIVKNTILKKNQKSIDINKTIRGKIINKFSLECAGYTPTKEIIDFSLKLHNIKLAQTNKYFIRKISELSESANITLVLEPVPKSEYYSFIESSAYNDLITILNKLPNIKFIDTNKIITFKDCFFKDYLHLKSEKRYLYEYIIFNRIID